MACRGPPSFLAAQKLPLLCLGMCLGMSGVLCGRVRGPCQLAGLPGG